MKNKIIRFIKNHPFLYNLAKKINRRLKVTPPKKSYSSDYIYYAYILKEAGELNKIKEHYKRIERENTKLFVIVDNEEYSQYIHKFIRENVNILFASMQYFEKYNKKLKLNKYLLLDYKDNKFDSLLNYII